MNISSRTFLDVPRSVTYYTLEQKPRARITKNKNSDKIESDRQTDRQIFFYIGTVFTSTCI